MWDGMTMQCSEPVWEPLEAVVGSDIADGFMWMAELELDGQRRVQAYKSIATRRYLYLNVENQAFAYHGGDRFEAVALSAALEHVFEDWDYLLPAATDPDAVQSLLARHRAGEDAPVETPR